MPKLVLWISLCISMLAFQAHAEAYRWVDAQGNVHYGDRPPDKAKAEDISAQIKQQNVDESGATTKKLLEQHDRRSAAVKTENQQLTEESDKREQRKEEACKEARRQLKIVKGRVVFYDNDGQEVKVTEKEREARATSITKAIEKYCD